MESNLSALSSRFGIPSVLQLAAGAGNLPCINVASPLAQAQVYLHGAHVAQWQPRNCGPVLFVSGKSYFQGNKPIRGGVPLCFPWFGPKAGDTTAPAHGFARLMEWQLQSTRQLEGGEIEIVLQLETTPQTQAAWAADATMRHRIVIGETLSMTLEVTNRGAAPITFEEAQHTYFSIGDIHRVEIHGLEGATYLDKMDGARRKVQEGPGVFTGETDRVYLNTRHTCTIEDPLLRRAIRIERENSDGIVVWNPWINKAKAMADMGDEEWPGMVCVETCNIGDYAVTLAAGQSHQMATRISVGSLAG
jgi:glucose-6-phosphate 1-epimerase